MTGRGHWRDAIEQRWSGAMTAEALVPIKGQRLEVHDQGLDFMLCCVPEHSPANDDTEADDSQQERGSPFLPPDPQLTVGPIGSDHVMVLNKYPVARHHVVLASSTFEDQQTGLNDTDFFALASLLEDAGGLGFYNAGPSAGASQRHKHMQWIPSLPEHAGLNRYTQAFNDTFEDGTLISHPGLPWTHLFLRVLDEPGLGIAQRAESLHLAYQTALKCLGLSPDKSAGVAPFNMLVEDGWMMMVPRRQARVEGITLNALSYGGFLELRRPEHLECVQQIGPLTLLSRAAWC